MATPKSPASDTYTIFGFPRTPVFKDMRKAYKSLLTNKKHHDKNPSSGDNDSHSSKLKEEKHRVEKTNAEEAPTLEKLAGLWSIDDSTVMKRRTSFLSRVGSRRSHTPQARPTYIPSKTLAPSSPLPSVSSPTGTFFKSMREPSPPGGAPSPSVSSSEGSARLGRNISRRSTTPIVFSQSTNRQKPQPIERKLECNLEELCHGTVKNIKISRNVITDEGLIVQEEEVLKINVKPGWKQGTKITFEGKGHEKPGYLPADLVFTVEEKRHPLFKRRGDDLEIAVEIPLVKALTGCTLSVPLLGGEKMVITEQDVIFPGYERSLKGQGMPNAKEGGRRGDLRITFLVKFPRELSEEKKAMAYDILKDCSWS